MNPCCFRAIMIAVVAFMTYVPAASPPVSGTVASDGDYAAKLAALGTDPKEAIALGKEIADLPAERGWLIMKNNWSKVPTAEAKQQLLMAWFFGKEIPKPRVHPHLGDVLALGEQDPSKAVHKLAENLRKKTVGQSTPQPANDSKNDAMADIADIPYQDLRAEGDEDKRYILIGPRPNAKKPAEGYRLVVALPGGDGGADFRPFLQRVLKNTLPDDTVIAQLVAPKWTEGKHRIVWPTHGLKDEKMKFSTEKFIAAVIGDADKKIGVDHKRVDALGWSSGGPAVYATALAKESPLRGAFVAMSVFKPETLPPLEGAAGRRFFILHSPKDFISMDFPKAAEEKLRVAGGTTRLLTYEGGHGWRGNVYGNMRTAFEWLDTSGKQPL